MQYPLYLIRGEIFQYKRWQYLGFQLHAVNSGEQLYLR